MIRIARVLSLFVALTLIAGLAGDMTAKGRNSNPKDKPVSVKQIPPELMPPAGAVLAFEMKARGDQIYTCAAKPEDPAAFTWTFKAPEAALLSQKNKVVGSHFAGPTWQSEDGSSVKAAVVARVDASSKNAIPWLLLEAKSHDGSGIFSSITHIQRLATKGGVAPTKGCDAAHAGAEARVTYQATYAFYGPAAS